MFKKFAILVLTASIFVSCNRRMETALKSSDKDYILKIANEFYEEGKWINAIELYSRVAVAFAGTEEGVDIAYKQATANFKDRNYRLAGHQYKTFYISNPSDPRAEEAAFQSAYSFYVDSPEYNLDQTSTYNAINELQAFINLYPNSSYVPQANAYIDELRHKLEKKAFEIAKIYYKTLKYKAAGIAFDNMIDDFPDTKYREEAMIYSLRSKYELAVNYSRIDVKELRLQNTLTQYRLFIRQYPNSKFRAEADKINERTNTELTKHKELMARLESSK
ncbi:MAG: outer membrane protein assembly factor BamD [Weeksellaceae bacterium]|nr:outer membrane protein assembly factor BamD [Weeksellaceae bacterium]MDX9704212.1 outer membrane protein assembly factor BamD [Weeksellaceae bacterium]